MTITEALAEIKLIDSKLDKKRSTIRTYLTRQDQLKDPLATEGGSVAFIKAEQQSIGDLENRKVTLRRAIARANEQTDVTVGNATKSIADWLVWRRDVAPGRQSFLTQLWQTIEAARRDAQSRGYAVVEGASSVTRPGDIVVNVDVAALSREAENLVEVLGNLDGQLSLKNATVQVEV
jgi:hypothetical protein